MKVLTITNQSFRAIFANKGRSFLTILGIVIGIGSVIALISLGNGVKSYISNQIGKLGTTNLMVFSGAGFGTENSGHTQRAAGPQGGNFGGGPNLTINDYNSLMDKAKNPHLASVVGGVSGSAVLNNQRFGVNGTSTNFFSLKNFSAEKGQIFNNNDVTSKNKVMVLGNNLATDLFDNTDPIGQTVTIGSDKYNITAILKKVDESTFDNPNDQSFVPYTSAMDSFGSQKFSSFIVTATDEKSVNLAKSEIQNTLLQNHNISDMKLADFSVTTPADILSTVSNITGTMTALLSGIAAISLIVGGIGIMNIMLVSVTERTREIGLRKAVGAKTSDILIQFLIEAIILTLTGGVIGIILGYAMAKIAGHYVGFPPVTTQNSILLAVGISTLVGLIFGIYPALRAANLNPIDALRYE